MSTESAHGADEARNRGKRSLCGASCFRGRWPDPLLHRPARGKLIAFDTLADETVPNRVFPK